MKRLFPLLMIFIIAIFIIGCDNKTPEETVLGIKQVSLDTNVPPSDQLATITEEEKDPLYETIATVVREGTVVESAERDSSFTRLVTNDNATYKGEPIFGSLTMQGESSGTGKLSTSKVTLCGTLSFGVNKYKMIDFIISYDEDDSNGEKEMKNIKFDGTLLCNDKEVDLSTLSIDDPLISLIVCPDEEGGNVFISDLPTSTTASYLAYDSSAVKGEYSSCKKTVSGSTNVDIRLDFDKVKMEDGYHSFSCRFLMESIPPIGFNMTFDYIELDGKYFDPASIEADGEFFGSLMMALLFIGI